MIEAFTLPEFALKLSSDVKLMDFVVDVVLVGETFTNFVTSRPSITIVYPNVSHLNMSFSCGGIVVLRQNRQDSTATPAKADAPPIIPTAMPALVLLDSLELCP